MFPRPQKSSNTTSEQGADITNGDGVEVLDGVLVGTTLTSASANFTSAISGKLLSIAGYSGVAICTYVNPSTVTLSVSLGADNTNLIFYYGSDCLAAFSAAVAAAASDSTIASFPNGNRWTVESSRQVTLQVSAGIYLLSAAPVTNGLHTIWEFQSGAVVEPINFLPGKVVYPGIKLGGKHFGIKDAACSFSVITGALGTLRSGAQIAGFVAPSDLSWYTFRDSVAQYIYNMGMVPTLTKTNTTFTATTAILAVPLTAAEIELLRVGMVIDTSHSPKRSGLITGWAGDGTTITVSNWYKSTGSAGGATVPAGSATIYVNAYTKVWAQDSVVGLHATSHADYATGYEFDMQNNKAAYDPVTELPNVRGIEVANLGTYQCASGYQLIGDFYYAFDARGTGYAAFSSKGTQTYHFHSWSFKVTQAGGVTAKTVAAETSITSPLYSAGTATWRSGNGSPESVITAPVGSLYSRLDGGVGTTLYVKESGTGNTGWTAK